MTNGYVVVTTTYGLQALQLDDESPAWEARLEGYAPAGRGVRIGSQFHLPATFPIDPDAGEGVPRPKGILTVDLDTGRVLIASRLDDPALSGNLAAFNGTLVSAGFNAVAAFEPLSHLEQQLAGGSANPNDARVPAMRGRLALHQGRVEEGIELLRKAALLDENSDAQGDLVFAVLEKLRNREIVAERALELLEGIEVKGRQRTVFSRLRAESLANSEKHLDAFRAFIELGRDTPVDSGLILNPDNVVSTAGRRWVASRLAGIHDSVRKSNQDDLLALETLIQKPLTDGQPTVDDLRRWLELFAWHEQASDVRLQLSRFLLRKTGDVPLLEAEQLLSRVVNSHESALAAEARKELIEVWIRSGQAESAVADFEQLKADWNSRSPGGLNAESLIEKWSREEQVKRLLGRGDWARTAPATKTETIFKRFEHRYILPVIGDPGPAFSGWTFEINLVRNVFLARGPLGKERWSIRVTGPDGGVPRVHPAATSVHCQGHLVVLSMSSRFLVYDASGKTTKELWNRSLLPRDNAQLFLVPQKRGLGGYRLQTHDERPIGSVDLVLSDSVVYRKGRVLHLARLDDGQVLWQRDDVEPEAVVIGNEQSLAVLDLEANTAELLAPFDGSSKQQSAFSPIGRLIAAAGTDPVATMSGNDTLQLARFDAATGKPVWSFEYSPNALMRVIRGRNIVILDPDGRIHVRDADTGALRVETRGNGFQQLSAFQVLETAGGFVLLTSVPTESTSRIPVPLGLQGVVQPRVNSDDQLISLSQPRDLPSFVLAAERRVYNREQRRIESIDFPIEIIDSRSGRTVFEQTLKNRTMGYRLDADLDAQTIRYTFDRLQIDLDYLQPDE